MENWIWCFTEDCMLCMTMEEIGKVPTFKRNFKSLDPSRKAEWLMLRFLPTCPTFQACEAVIGQLP